MLNFVAILIPALPLLASLVTAALGPRLLREKSHWPCVGATALASVLAIVFLIGVAASDEAAHEVTVYQWATVAGTGGNDLAVGVTLRADSLAAIMLVIVTLISTAVVVFSIGYMRGDPGYWRFFAIVSLFIFSMTMLVLAGNFLLLYVFWEAVGLCSYLLIGFWYERPAAAAAGKKAFLVNRIGDLGFALGVFLIWVTFGGLDYQQVLDPARIAEIGNGTVLAICLLLFAGAVGKSAQFPLHVWLPDAMEGPTPVSALIHAATMVTAGVYMVARCTPLFEHAPEARLVVASIGCFTALLAALIALTQNDLKRVLAYSTVSQLGYMFLGLGTGSMLGIVGGMFHLVTHAFFKALLFLGAGSVMHAMGGVVDMRRFGGLGRRMPTTAWTFGIGSLALAGFPLLSGFWSKDEILAAVGGADASPLFGLLFWVATATALVTAFYTTRAFLMTFWGEEKIPDEAGGHAHESPAVMTWPLMALAGGAALVGILLGPTGLMARFLERTPGMPSHEAEHAFDWATAGLGTLAALAGIGLGWLVYGSRVVSADSLARLLRPLYRLSLNKFYLDEIYYAAIVLPGRGLAQACRFLDWILVDGLVNLVARVPALVGRMFLRPIQNGLVQFYALAMLMGMVVLIVSLLWRAP